MLHLWGNHTANYRGCVKWKEIRQPLRNSLQPLAVGQPPRANLRPRNLSGPSSLSVLSNPALSFHPQTHPNQSLVTATAKEAKSEKVKPKITLAPKNAAVKPKNAARTGAKPVTTPKSIHFPARDLRPPRLPLQACVQLICRLLASISSLAKGAACPRAVLKTVILCR